MYARMHACTHACAHVCMCDDEVGNQRVDVEGRAGGGEVYQPEGSMIGLLTYLLTYSYLVT